ncbi:MAG: amino acid adenylation domain-containing protein [Chloroflexota bacterium]
MSTIPENTNLTQAQYLMWLGQQLNPEVPLYNMIQAYEFSGEIDAKRFEAAFQLLISKSDALRMVIETDDESGIPMARIREALPFALEVVDLSVEEDPEAAYTAWVSERKIETLSLETQLFDTALLKLGPQRTIWYLCKHHLITDGGGFLNVYRNLAEFYALALKDELHLAPDIPQFADFAAYERENRQSDAFAEASEYWAEKISEPLAPIDFYGQISGGRTSRTDRVRWALDAERSNKLREIAMEEDGFASLSLDMSLFVVMGTMLSTTIHRIAGLDKVRFGTPFYGRPTQAFKETIGLFIEIGPLQVEIEAGETFNSLGEKVMGETYSGLMNAQSGISNAEMNRSYDLLLNFVNAKFPDFAGMPVTTDWIHTGYGDQNHALRLQVTDFDNTGSFVFLFDVNVDIFGAQERRWLINQFEAVIDAFIASPNRTIGSFSLQTEAEHLSLFETFNQTDALYASDKTVVDLFEAQAAETPYAFAATRGETSLTYAELNSLSTELAHTLREVVGADLQSETRIAISMERSLEVLIAIWGVLKAGFAYVPLDPSTPEERLQFMLEDIAPAAVLSDEGIGRLGDRVIGDSENSAPVFGLKLDPNKKSIILNGSTITPPSPHLPISPALHPPTSPSQLAYMIYTSGSTGRPKGTMLTHQGLMNYISWAKEVYQEGEILDFPLYSSLAFDLTITSIFVPMMTGGRIVVYSEADHIRGLEILSVFQDDMVDLVKLTPAHLSLVQERGIRPERISRLIVGGEDFKTDLAESVVGLFDHGVKIYNEYGPTEAVVGCMIHQYNPEQDTKVSIPIGTPAANARIYLLDPYKQPVPSGVLGEMFISSDGVAKGYRNRPELTAERFTDDPFRTGARMYQTGDVARWGADGQLVFLGRRDHQVKINGARIELGEIEAALLSHPNVTDVVLNVVQYERRPAEEEVIFCSRCGLPSNFPNTTFNEDRVCNFCTDFDTFREDVFQYFKTQADLDLIVNEAKEVSKGKYDAMMLFSGGKDSSYVLSQLVENGLRVLAWSLDNGYISEDAKENIKRVTGHLGVDLVFATTPHMNAIFADSLKRFSNVCNGCYKAIYTLSMNEARRQGIKYIFTGLSRGQLFETRLHELFRNRMFDVEQMDHAIAEARKVYHRVDDAVHRLLDVSMFSDDRIFNQIQFVDYFRYTDVELDEMYNFLSTRVPWIRPADTGRSTNCLVNEAGIHVHKTERGYHNYALPYSWDVRLGHKTRAEAMEELDDDIRMPMVNQMLEEIGYEISYKHAERTEKRLAAYFVADHSITIANLRDYLSQRLPDFMLPAYFVRLDKLPLTTNGKVDRVALPSPTHEWDYIREIESTYMPPESEVEIELAAIWAQTLNLKRVGVHDNFFDLGGNSVPAVQVVAKINRTFGIEFPLRAFFDSPTIAGQSLVIEELMLAALEEMSDEEVEALLAEMEGE